jgi:alpha-ribazole phosphatase
VIVLVRHPPVASEGRCYGRLDLEVEPDAVASLAAEILRRGLPHPATIWTSPARRCRLVAEHLGPHHVDPRLQELDFGDWEGLPWDSVPRASLDQWAADPWNFAPPNGETGTALNARVQAFAAECATGDHVIITHGGPLKILTAILGGNPVDLLAPPPDPGAVVVSA